MPATIVEIEQGLMNALKNISGLRCYRYQPDAILDPPIAYPSLNTIEYHKAMHGGMRTYAYTVTVIMGRVNDDVSQGNLDMMASYDGPTSVRAALEADRTLGGLVDTLIVSSSANVSMLSQGDNNFITVDFTLTVYG